MRIAVADDDKDVRDYVTSILQRAEYACTSYNNGRELITALQRETFDLLVVDWNMPEQNGIEAIHWARRNLVPCPPMIMMTSRTDSADIVMGLEAGADDYIVKPAEPTVLVARVRSALRRAVPQEAQQRFQTFGEFELDRSTNTVKFRGSSVSMTPKEFALAELFLRNGHRPLSRGYILQMVWNSVADLPTRTLDMHVSRVRAKLSLNPEYGYRLQTVFGYGYRFEQFEKQE